MSEKLTWIKSTYSGSDGGNCVEVASEPERVHIRDSKFPAFPHLTTTPNAWAALVNFAATT